MATPTSGEISISDLQSLYSPVRTAPGSLGDYYAGGSVVASGEKLSGGAGAAIPTAPSELSLSNFYDLRATVHGAALTASTAASVFDGIDVSWTASGNGESADSWQIGWRPSPSSDPYTYLSSDYQGNPITSTSATITIPSTPGATLHDLVVRGINDFGTGVDSSPQTAYKKAPTADYLYDSPVSSTVGSIAGEGISTVHVYAAVGAGGSTGPYVYLGGNGPGGIASPTSTDGGHWWQPHYTYQKDMAGAGGGGAGAIGYKTASIPVTPSTPVTITVGTAPSDGNGGTTTVNIGGTNYVVAAGGSQGGRGGIVEGSAPGTPAGLPSATIPASPYTAAYNGPAQQIHFLQKGYYSRGWDSPVNPGIPPGNAPTEPVQFTHIHRTMTALRYGVAGDGGSAGSVTTGTDARSPTHTNDGDGYAGVNVDHNRPIGSWPNTFGAMQGRGAVGYTITVPNSDTVPGLPGNVPLNGPAYPGSGSLTVNVGYGGNWKAPAFPTSYGKIYYDGFKFGPASFPGHDDFQDTPAPVMGNPSYAEPGGGGFAWIRFNDAPGSISAHPHSEYIHPTAPAQHSANGVSVPSDGLVYYNMHSVYPPTTTSGYPAPLAPNFEPNHVEPPNASGYGASIGGGPSVTPSPGHVNKTQKVTYFPLSSSSGVTVDPGTLGQTQAFTNHAVLNSPDDSNKSYAAGGYGLYASPTDEGIQTAIARFEFPSTSITSSVATLSTGRAGHFGFSLGVSNQGYVGGGWTSGITGPQAAVNTMERFSFPSEAVATEPNNIGTSRMSGASGASMDYGYLIGGRSKYPSASGNTDYDDITKFTGASGSTSVTASDLAEFPYAGASLAWSNSGYIVVSDEDFTGISTIPLASGQRSAGYGELRDLWYGQLARPGYISPAIRGTSIGFAGTAVSAKKDGYLASWNGRIERFPFSSGYYQADSTAEISPTSSTYGYGYGAPGVG